MIRILAISEFLNTTKMSVTFVFKHFIHFSFSLNLKILQPFFYYSLKILSYIWLFLFKYLFVYSDISHHSLRHTLFLLKMFSFICTVKKIRSNYDRLFFFFVLLRWQRLTWGQNSKRRRTVIMADFTASSPWGHLNRE